MNNVILLYILKEVRLQIAISESSELCDLRTP